MKGYSPHAQTLADPQTFLTQLELVSHLLQPEKYKESNNSNVFVNVMLSPYRSGLYSKHVPIVPVLVKSLSGQFWILVAPSG